MADYFNRIAQQGGCVADNGAELFFVAIAYAMRVAETPGLTTCAKTFYRLAQAIS